MPPNSHEWQRDPIREQIALATIDLDDARHEETDVESLYSMKRRSEPF